MLGRKKAIKVGGCYFEVFIFFKSAGGFTNDSEGTRQDIYQNFLQFFIAFFFDLIDLIEDGFFIVDIEIGLIVDLFV